MLTGIVIYISLSAIVVVLSACLWLRIELYFLRFKLENHPILILMVEDVLEKIRKEYDILVIRKTYEEMNKGITNENEKALGFYIYASNSNSLKRNKETLRKIDDIEKEWKKSFRELCKLVGSECGGDREDFVIPRIELCTDEVKMYGLASYYSTYFHELGHHISTITKNDHSDEAADAIAYQLVYDNLPYFFQLIPIINFHYRVKKPELTLMERLHAYYQFLSYLRVKNSWVFCNLFF